MIVQYLPWDSIFFERKVFSIKVQTNVVNVKTVIDFLIKEEGKLGYLFTLQDTQILNEDLIKCELVDFKMTYFKSKLVSNYFNNNIVEFTDDLNINPMYELSHIAGKYSRFNVDPLLSPRFKQLYDLWIENSINKIIADKVFVYIDQFKKILGMATLKFHDSYATIGLIAIDPHSQLIGIGKALIRTIESSVFNKGITNLMVTTQGNNQAACNFYEALGFEISLIENVYHMHVN